MAWQKTVPKKSGQYWTATRDGFVAGLSTVCYNDDGVLVYAGGTVAHEAPSFRNPGITVSIDFSWKGWWWDKPIKEPAPPPKNAWADTPDE